MVEKISVSVKIAALNVEHNFLIPCDMTVSDATALVVKSVAEEYRGAAIKSTHEYVLMRSSDGKLLDRSCTFKQLDVVQGERLIFI
jgi:hypothetical protein